jgi:hypothetical protein
MNSSKGTKNKLDKSETEYVAGPPAKKARGPLSNDIADMLFGFGDSWPPNVESVNLIEKVATEYIQDLSARALQVADLRPSGKLDKECFLYLVRKERNKFLRINKLLAANKEIKAAQKKDIDDKDENSYIEAEDPQPEEEEEE